MASKAARRRWERDTPERTAAKHLQTAAEAQAAAASIVSSAILFQTETGAEAHIDLRDGGILEVGAPGLGIIATIRAGDGWATAIVSPRVLNGAPGSGGTGERGETEPFSYGHVERVQWGVAIRFDKQSLCPTPLADAIRAAARALHPSWDAGQCNAEVQRVWENMRAEP